MIEKILSMDIKETFALIGLIFGFSAALLGTIYTQITKHEVTRTKILIPWLKEQNTLKKYHSALDKLLNKLQRFYGSANTLKAFNVSLLLAYIYPLLFFTIAYSFLGGSHEFSGLKVLPDESNFRWFYAPVFIVVLVFLYYIFSRSEPLEKKAIEWINQSLSLSIKNSTVLFRVMGALLSASIVYFNGSPISIIFLFLIMGYISPVIVATFAVAFAFAVAGAVEGNYQTSLVIATFFLLFPIINACLDWISWRVSRYFLRHAKQQDKLRKILIDIIIDLIVAIALMVALCLLLPLGIEGVNWHYSLFSDSTIDWQKIALETHNDPWGKGAMITLMIVTTLIPTMIHISMALFAIIVNLLGGRKLAALLVKANKTKDNLKPMTAAVWLFAYYLIVIVLMIGLYWIIIRFVDFPVADWLYAITAYFYDLPAIK